MFLDTELCQCPRLPSAYLRFTQSWLIFPREEAGQGHNFGDISGTERCRDAVLHVEKTNKQKTETKERRSLEEAVRNTQSNEDGKEDEGMSIIKAVTHFLTHEK